MQRHKGINTVAFFYGNHFTFKSVVSTITVLRFLDRRHSFLLCIVKFCETLSILLCQRTLDRTFTCIVFHPELLLWAIATESEKCFGRETSPRCWNFWHKGSI